MTTRAGLEIRDAAAAAPSVTEPLGPLHVTFALRAFPIHSETFILRQVTGLLDLGHQVHILSELRPRGEVVHPAVRDYALAKRVTYIHEAWQGPGGLPVGALSRLAVTKPRCMGLLRREQAAPHGGRRPVLNRLRGLLGTVRTDVLHSHFGDIGLWYAEIASRLRIPHVVSFYGYDCSRFPLERGVGAYAPLFRQVGRVIALSDSMRDRLVQLGCPSAVIHKMRLGVDPSEYGYRVPGPASPR